MPETPEGLIEHYETKYGLSVHDAGQQADLFMFRQADYEIMQWSQSPNHVDDCDCELPDEMDDRCRQQTEWRWAVVIDDAAHGPRFVCWADQSASDQFMPHYAPYDATKGADDG